jgi:hypothetical protein
MMGRFRNTRLRDDFFASPLAQGERMKVRGSNELALNQSSRLPSPLDQERRPSTRGVVQIF